MKWLFLTVALGDDKYRGASRRLVEQAKKLGIFSEYVVVDLNLIENYWPDYRSAVPVNDWNEENRFGHFIWKPVLAELAANGLFGNYYGICYLDAGCEILPSYFSRKSFLKLMSLAEVRGPVVFSTGARESLFNKQYTVSRFNPPSSHLISNQIAGGSWLVCGDQGKKLLRDWSALCKSDYNLIDDDFDSELESIEFVAHRHDQSVFSLLCKQNQIEPYRVMPPGSSNSLKTSFRNFIFAFRWARNRDEGQSNPAWLRRLGVGL